MKSVENEGWTLIYNRYINLGGINGYYIRRSKTTSLWGLTLTPIIGYSYRWKTLKELKKLAKYPIYSELNLNLMEEFDEKMKTQKWNQLWNEEH